MRRIWISSIPLMVVALSAVTIAGDLESGLQAGAHAGAFNVKDCTGPNADKSLCYR
jgi:hypothetical protein